MNQYRRRQPPKRNQRQRFNIAQISPRLLKLATVLSVGLVVSGGFLGVRAWLSNPQNLPISQIDIQGELKFIKDAELRAVINKYAQTNLYLLDTEALEADLETQSWVRAVTLRKSWPNQLTVVVEEQRPVAFWGHERLMNQFGELFAGDLPSMKGVFPTLYSPEEKGREMAERFLQMRTWLHGMPLEIAELTEDASGAWRIKFKNGPEVLVGNEDQERRIARFKVGFQQELVSKLSNVRRVDLRYTNGFAVEWKQTPLSLREAVGVSRRS